MTGRDLPSGAYKTSVESAEVIDEPSNSATVRPLARADEGSSSVSMTWVALDGQHQELASGRSTRIYYVLSGVFTFVLDGGQPVPLVAGEVLVIPRGCRYSFEGTGTYLVLNTPAFQPGDDEYTEPSPGGGPTPRLPARG